MKILHLAENLPWKAILFLFVAAYIAILLFSPKLGPTDDFIFLRTLQEGKPLLYYSENFPYYNAIESGRFTPFVASEYNLYYLLSSSPSPFWYYFSHAVELVGLIFIFSWLLKTVSEKNIVRYGLPILLTLLPGFTFTWFRLQLNERNLLFFLATFFLAYLAHTKRPRFGYLLLAFASAQGIIYYKETGFIVIGAFALFHLLFSWKTSDRKARALDIALIASALLYIILYAIYVLPYGGILEHGKTPNPFEVFIKNILNYAVVTDPYLILLALPLALWRGIRICFKKEVAHPIFDSILFASVFFMVSYFILNLHGPYYLLPLYAVIPLPLFHFLSRTEYRTIFWKGALLISTFLFVGNTIPAGIHYLAYYKYMPINFDRTMEFLREQVRGAGRRVPIYFAGVNRGSGNWNYFIFSEFFQYKGLDVSEFDLRAEREDVKVRKEQPLPLPIPSISLPFTVFESEILPPISQGDYLVVSPQSIDPVKNSSNHAYLESLEREGYQPVFAAKSAFAFPMLTLKEAGRYLLSLGAEPGETFLGISRKIPNWELPNYYVYVRK